MQRFAFTIGLRKESLAEYHCIHVKIWPEIEAAIRDAGITNYSIYHREGQLFGYYEYTGPPAEYAERMQRLADAPRMREWWDITEPMQIPHPDRPNGQWWTPMDEMFHQD